MPAKPTTAQAEFARAVFKHNARPFGHIQPLWSEHFKHDIYPHLGCSFGIVESKPELYRTAPKLEPLYAAEGCYAVTSADGAPILDGEHNRLSAMWDRLEASERRPLLYTRYLLDVEESTNSAPYHVPLTPYRILRPEDGSEEVWLSSVLLGLVSNDPVTLFESYRYEQTLLPAKAVRVLSVSRYQGKDVLTPVAWLMPVMHGMVTLVQSPHKE